MLLQVRSKTLFRELQIKSLQSSNFIRNFNFAQPIDTRSMRADRDMSSCTRATIQQHGRRA